MSGTVHLKHRRIAVALEKEIRSGQVERGTRLPGELSLARRFGVSRNTVRTALAELNEAGLISTRTGKGSFVMFDGRPLDDRLGWAHALAAQGAETRVRVLAITARRDDRLAERLNLDSPEVIVVERVREIVPRTVVSYECSRVPALEGLSELPGRGLGGDSLTEELGRAGLHADHGEQRVRGRRIDEREAALLGRDAGEWFLNTERTSWTAGGAFVEHVDSLLDPEHFQLLLNFNESSS
ncbi:GntR family transcriptional regulator [Streptosporangium sp. 'caverna']|uniref:GntR family transcriptional regulator n=1 Tax=Streptosporangium sp. 'caverna' TaxID=2202249 RepID=UPI000D7E6C0B|nr:GntR family transcriptional regulator [Streptosporangium sp. 'caverna']AWS41642.1 GntR family transcriptional regulator [Streptosporangium sp. 'caverna']